VLVVGAGPTGLALAVELARHGARCRIVDALPEPSPQTKATEIHARTLELLDQAGLAEAFVAGGIVMKGAAFHSGGRCIAVLSYEGVECELPASLSFTQHDTERVLTTALTEHGGAVDRGCTVVGLEQDAEAVVVTLQRADGTTARVRAEWVVACDGAHSTLRESLGISLDGGEYPSLLAGLNARVEGMPYPRDQYQVFLDETDHWLGPIPGGWIRNSFTSEARTERPTAEELQGVFDRHSGPGTRVCEIADAAYFRLHHSVASAYRRGRVLLAGDAAHQSSPVGGTGMNTGLQDAFNLGWKLALVTARAAAPSLVDSYEAERRPVAQATVKMIDDLVNSRLFGEAAAIQTRDRQMAVQFTSPLARLAAVETGHGLRIDYRSSPLVAGHRGDRHSRGRHPVTWTGPAPGDRVYAPGPLVTADDTTTSLREILRGTAHQLLILAGEADAATLQAYADLAARAVARFRPWLAAHAIVVADRPPSVTAPGVTVLADPGFGVHGHLGAVADTLYLVRPDGYLGYRAEPPDGARLADYFAGLGFAGH
jgi:2-polyprenyl-6-methoxyphenol hydroxylase-like FAD-dependent oxidoreductase